MLPWKPEFQSDLAQNLMQPFPHLNDASDKIWLQSAHWLRRYSCLKVWADARTDGRTPARVPSYKLTLWASGSGELKSLLEPRRMAAVSVLETRQRRVLNVGMTFSFRGSTSHNIRKLKHYGHFDLPFCGFTYSCVGRLKLRDLTGSGTLWKGNC